MQNLKLVLPAVPHAAVWAAAAFLHNGGGWGPIPPNLFLLISLVAGTLPPSSLDHRPLLITLHCRPGWGNLVEVG